MRVCFNTGALLDAGTAARTTTAAAMWSERDARCGPFCTCPRTRLCVEAAAAAAAAAGPTLAAGARELFACERALL